MPIPISSLPIGAKIKDPNTKYNGSVITWKILDQNHKNFPANSTTLISLHGDTQTLSPLRGLSTPKTYTDFLPIGYFDNWLNGMSQDMKKKLLTTNLSIASSAGNAYGPKWVSVPSQIFLLGEGEIDVRSGYFIRNVQEGIFPPLSASNEDLYSFLGYTNQFSNFMTRTLSPDSSQYNVYPRYLTNRSFGYLTSSGTAIIHPIINLMNDTMVSDSPDTDGAYIIKPSITKYLFQDGNDIKTYKDNVYWAILNGASYVDFSKPVIPIGAKSIRFKIKKNGMLSKTELILANSNGSNENGINVYFTTLNEIVFQSNKGTSGDFRFQVLFDFIPYADNQWHEILFTWDGTTNLDGAKVYVDDFNVPVATATAKSTETVNSTRNMRIGRSYNTVAGSEYFLNALLSDLKIFAGGNQDTLISHYKFSGGVNDEISSNHGTNYGATFGSEKSWLVIGSVPVTETMFNTDGMDTVSLDDEAVKKLISNKPELLAWTDDTSKTSISVKSDMIPVGQLIQPTDDIDIGRIENFDNITVTANASGAGIVKLIVSVDSGATWYSLIDGVWTIIDISDISKIKANGMNPISFNAVTKEQWAELRGSSEKMRFAYYLEIDNVTDVANTDELSMTVDMRGTWIAAVPVTEYHYYYLNNHSITINLLTDGDFKINY